MRRDESKRRKGTRRVKGNRAARKGFRIGDRDVRGSADRGKRRHRDARVNRGKTMSAWWGYFVEQCQVCSLRG